RRLPFGKRLQQGLCPGAGCHTGALSPPAPPDLTRARPRPCSSGQDSCSRVLPRHGPSGPRLIVIPMPFHKHHQEFARIDLATGWELPPGYEPGSGAGQKILSGSLDENAGSGFRTRLLRFPPGFHTSAPFVHSYWEEVVLLAGDLWVGNDPQGNGG